MPIGVGNWYFSCALYQLDAGEDISVVSDLNPPPHSLLYKAFGHFDLASVNKSDSLDDLTLFQEAPSLKHARIIAGVPFSGQYTSPDILLFCEDAPCIGFVSLEIDKWLYSPESGAGSGLQACNTLIEHINKNFTSESCELGFYGGYGRSELLVLVKSEKINDIFDFLSFTRTIQLQHCFSPQNERESDLSLPVFTTTKTIPLISYKNIIKDKEGVHVRRIKGNVHASVNIECLAGYEQFIDEYFKNKKPYSLCNTLGQNDVTINTTSEIPIAQLAEDILSFRVDWKNKYTCPITTKTKIHWPFNADKCLEPQTYTIKNTEFTLTIPYNLTKKNRTLANNIRFYLHHLDVLLRDRSTQFSVGRLRDSPEYIKQTLAEHDRASADNDNIQVYTIEGSLQELIDSIAQGIEQRLTGSFYHYNSNPLLPVPLSDGIFSNSLAIESIIQFCFSEWGKNNNEKYMGELSWIGFTIFSDSVGFKLRLGEVIYLPMAATIRPFSPEGNWLTVTHEISHAIYNRLNIINEYKEAYEETRTKNFSNFIIEQTLGPDKDFDDIIFELFAHWYDFYHFYDKDITFYLKSIWQSWLFLPIVHVNFNNYFLRSFVVFVYRDLEELIVIMKTGPTEFKAYVEQSWNEHLTKIPIGDHQLTFISNQKKSLLELFYKLNVLLILIFNNSKDDSFRESINDPYPTLDDHIGEVIKGNIILEKINNPFLLVKNIWKKTFEEDNAKINNSLIFSLKNGTILLEDSDE